MGKLIDLTGQRFGRLVVLKRGIATDGRGEAFWLCQCDCGNITTVSGYKLRSGHTRSCGCLAREDNSKRSTKNEVGNKYGKLTVVEYAGSSNGNALWKCQCDCGNYCLVRGKDLRCGYTMSCGCLGKSKGEYLIQEYLKSKNIEYKPQYGFKGLYGKSNYLLKFDFYLPKYNACIEFQGLQHFKSVDFFGGEKEYQTRQESDKKKKEYCDKHNVKLLYITYKDNVDECLDNFFAKEDNL